MNDWRFLPLGGEEWRHVHGYEGFYSVSSWGRIRRESAACGTWVGRILKPARGSIGYASVDLCRDGSVPEQLSVHRLVAIAFLGAGEPGEVVNHLNGIRSDNRVTNLEWCTMSENAFHAMEFLGYDTKGSAHPMAKLREADIPVIRALLGRGAAKADVALRFGVHSDTIHLIARRKTWRHVA